MRDVHGITSEFIQLIGEILVRSLCRLSGLGGAVYLHLAGSACIGHMDNFVVHVLGVILRLLHKGVVWEEVLLQGVDPDFGL